MFWSRGKANSQETKPPEERAPAQEPIGQTPSGNDDRDSAERELERALDTLGSMLRTIGKYAFDLPEQSAQMVGAECEGWANHLLVRSPYPGKVAAEATKDKVPVSRNWLGSARFIADLRKKEHSHLTKALDDLRQVIWAFARGLNKAIVADEKAGSLLKTQLSRLTSAAKNSSPQDLKREALSVASGLAEVFEARRKAQREQVAEFGARVAALGQALEEARRENALDPLTRLFNRKTFDEELSRVVDMDGILGGDLCLVLVDVDHFKQINDKFGHPLGDEVLRQLTGALARTFRHREDLVARYGGEEFAIILRDTQCKDATMLCDRLLSAVGALRIPTGNDGRPPIAITVSAGISEHVAGESDAEWLSRTDGALYEAKRGGRNRWVVAEPNRRE
jgi:diguanylate cyclase